VGTRVLRLNLKALIGLLRWPFPEGTSVKIIDRALPADARYVRTIRVEGDYAFVQLVSSAWRGDVVEPCLEHPVFKYDTPKGKIVLPGGDEYAPRERGN
jgi:hypothetical protein